MPRADSRTRSALARVLSVVVAALACAGVARAESPADFAHHIPLVLEGADGLFALEVPQAVYGGVVRADLRDLRVFNGAGQPVPHALLRGAEPAETPRPARRLAFFPIEADPAASLDRLELRVDRDGAATRLTVVRTEAARAAVKVAYLLDATALDEPVRALDLAGVPVGTLIALRVDASDDRRSWRNVAAEATVANLQADGASLARTRIDLGGVRAKYLRISWPAACGKVLELAAVSADLGATREPVERAWVERTGTVETSGVRLAPAMPSGRETDYAFDLGGQFPVDRVRIALPEANTVARIELLVRAKPDTQWRSVASTVVYRITRDGVELRSPEIAVPRTTERHWLLRVDARGGGVGAAPPVLHAGWRPERIVFAARGAPPFVLGFGSFQADAGALAIETLVPGYRADVPERFARARIATIDAAGRAEGAMAASSQRPLAPPSEPRDWKTWVLWIALVVGVGVVAAMAWRLSRELRAKPPGAG